ncbi:MAG: DUF4926 domain-containing protein [Ktedonobacterales bacterium]|nr:DUF4926 domain-containing protein [Ktedonobacterales bacterium]
MLQELERAVLLVDLPQQGLTAGDMGTVVMVHAGGQGYTVEFVTLGGATIAVETLTATQVRAVHPNEIAHVRQHTATPA